MKGGTDTRPVAKDGTRLGKANRYDISFPASACGDHFLCADFVANIDEEIKRTPGVCATSSAEALRRVVAAKHIEPELAAHLAHNSRRTPGLVRELVAKVAREGRYDQAYDIFAIQAGVLGDRVNCLTATNVAFLLDYFDDRDTVLACVRFLWAMHVSGVDKNNEAYEQSTLLAYRIVVAHRRASRSTLHKTATTTGPDTGTEPAADTDSPSFTSADVVEATLWSVTSCAWEVWAGRLSTLAVTLFRINLRLQIARGPTCPDIAWTRGLDLLAGATLRLLSGVFACQCLFDDVASSVAVRKALCAAADSGEEISRLLLNPSDSSGIDRLWALIDAPDNIKNGARRMNRVQVIISADIGIDAPFCPLHQAECVALLYEQLLAVAGILVDVADVCFLIGSRPLSDTSVDDYTQKKRLLVNARFYYEAALRLQEDFPSAMLGLANVHLANRDTKKARQLATSLFKDTGWAEANDIIYKCARTRRK